MLTKDLVKVCLYTQWWVCFLYAADVITTEMESRLKDDAPLSLQERWPPLGELCVDL